MKLYQLIWALLKHGMHGRWRDEVYTSVVLRTERRRLGLTGELISLDPVGSREDFCVLKAVSEDDGPHIEYPTIDDLIAASSLGTPEAKAMRDSVSDETVEKIMARVRQLDAQSRWRPS